MSYFPFFIELEGQRGLILGGGNVADRKVRMLLEFGVNLTVVSLEFSQSLRQLATEQKIRPYLTLEQRSFQEEDLNHVLFVITATDDRKLNHEIARLCRERHILINAVDQKEDCTFYFPSLVKRGEIVTGISSGGNSPVLVHKLRKNIEKVVPDYYPALNQQLGSIRQQVQEQVATEARRKQCFEELFAIGEEKKGILTEEEVESVIKKYISKEQEKGYI